MKESAEYLLSHGIRPSQQRIAVMKYLSEHHTHPTVDDIYNVLQPQMPTLSRTTVYNTLQVLCESGAIKQLTIDSHTSHYDGNIRPHAHFQCHKCSRIIDVPINNNYVESDYCDFIIDEVQIYYRGICSTCLRKNDKENKKYNS